MTHLLNQKFSSEEIMAMEAKYCANTYQPVPIVFEKGQGCKVIDPEGNEYYDFLSAYSCVNQGHCHPKIVKAMTEQCQKLSLCSRAFYNSVLALWAKYVTEKFGYDKVLPMNTGAEGVETALKCARRWGYLVKKIPKDEAIIICCKSNFHGRTLAAISMSTNPLSTETFGPLVQGIKVIPYNDPKALEDLLKECGDKVCGFIVEPLQGEAGVFVADDGYLKKCYDLCKKHNVLLICDEVQTGISRTGKLFCYQWDLQNEEKPDILILGKALSGGLYPVSCILADAPVMDVWIPGTHGSTFGGNPIGCACSLAALEVIEEEKMTEKAQELGVHFRKEIAEFIKNNKTCVKLIRGKGLLNAVDLDLSMTPYTDAYDVCKHLKVKGILAKQTHGTMIRFAPPLLITKEELDWCIARIKEVFLEVTVKPQ